jgi:hypothetical protein
MLESWSVDVRTTICPCRNHYLLMIRWRLNHDRLMFESWSVDDPLMLESWSLDDLLMLIFRNKVFGTRFSEQVFFLEQGFPWKIMISDVRTDDCIVSHRWLHLIMYRWLDDHIDDCIVSMIARYECKIWVQDMKFLEWRYEVVAPWADVACDTASLVRCVARTITSHQAAPGFCRCNKWTWLGRSQPLSNSLSCLKICTVDSSVCLIRTWTLLRTRYTNVSILRTKIEFLKNIQSPRANPVRDIESLRANPVRDIESLRANPVRDIENLWGHEAWSPGGW